MSETKIYHCTSEGNRERIQKSGYIRSESYVTTYPMKNLPSLERQKNLCLDDYAKGKCVYECEVHLVDLKIPPKGSQTCKGYPQYQLKKNLPINDCSCKCEGESGGNTGAVIFFGGILLAGLGIALLRKNKGTQGVRWTNN